MLEARSAAQLPRCGVVRRPRHNEETTPQRGGFSPPGMWRRTNLSPTERIGPQPVTTPKVARHGVGAVGVELHCCRPKGWLSPPSAPEWVQTTATLTQWIGGSESNRQVHSSPPSRPIQSCPVVVPK